ncbi:ABC transporter ATP-binding protein [Paenibacillus lutimineralis]|uniref:ABC transporter ATP-binding protein n=1 Tax=Paenibacillus lutimineralis TaxID=2707005 RepID=UPI001D049CAA|nr:ABC transporter ATP-binding protein [Paenibacillus lutimineralis]
MMRWLRKPVKSSETGGEEVVDAVTADNTEEQPAPESSADEHVVPSGEAATEQAATIAAESEQKHTSDEPSSPDQEQVEEPKGPILTVKDVHRSFPVGGGELHVLKGINMEVRSGQLVMLKGRSGSGKTTLLNMLGGLDQPSSGEIFFQDHPLHSLSDNQRTKLRRDRIGFIFQAYALLPLLSAWENVELSLRMANVPSSEWKSRVTHCLELVGLGKRMFHRPFEMSGGEQQRVAIAKAIAHRPKLLLADEPTANLDTQMGAQVMAVFKNIIHTEQVTICMTTHDPTILEVADHVYEMVDGRFIN